MKQVSEKFKEIQDEIIRPALSKLTLEIGTDVANVVLPVGYASMDFDTTVAPVVTPKYCRNTRYYAVLGDNTPVDDPNRICSPATFKALDTTDSLVPWGVTPHLNAHQRTIIGSSTDSLNFKNVMSPIEFVFLGGHLPTRIDVEVIDPNTGYWVSAFIYEDLNGIKNVTFTPDSYDSERLYRVEVHARTAGRFQVSYVKGLKSVISGATHVSFEKNEIEKVSLDMSTDLTSQSLPSYEMSVECLDINGVYSPESAYWDNQFKDGTPCYLTAAYEVNGVNEYVNLMYGKLTEKPDYEQGKIKFNIAVDWRTNWTYNFMPHLNDELDVGDSVDGNSFYQIIFNGKLFDSYSYESAETNYGGEVDTRDARQLIANAMGCFIKADFNKVDLLNANQIQYKDFDDYLTRYDQVKCNLESQSKVGRISVTRYNNTVASEYVDVETPDTIEVGSDDHRYGLFTFALPFFAMGKYEVVNAQSTNPDATVSLFSNAEVFKLDDGNYRAIMPFTADEITKIKPIVRFYKSDSANYEETEVLDDTVSGDVYTNDNQLVTNSVVASKVKQVAHLVSDISYQYEVDVVQDLRYEVGDIIRLETEKNVYKTCVVTSVKFNLPGSNGHITCRKVFSFYDSDEAIFEPVGLSVDFGLTDIEVTEASEKACFVGIMHTPIDNYIYVMGVEEFDKTTSGTTTQETYNATLTDLNNHVWKFAYYTSPSGTPINTSAPVVDIPSFDVSSGVSAGAFGAINLLKEIYKEQGMSAPVDYGCEWEEL